MADTTLQVIRPENVNSDAPLSSMKVYRTTPHHRRTLEQPNTTLSLRCIGWSVGGNVPTSRLGLDSSGFNGTTREEQWANDEMELKLARYWSTGSSATAELRYAEKRTGREKYVNGWATGRRDQWPEGGADEE